MKSIIDRHPLVAFFLLAFAISWGSYFALSGPLLFPFGAILAALIVASITRGREGLKDLLWRCLRWRIGLKWYAAAFLIPVAITLAIIAVGILIGATASSDQSPGPWYYVVLLFPMAMVDAPLWEDSAWRGFAMPAFPRSRSRLVNTLVLGLLLAAWHFPLALAGGDAMVPYLIATVASAFVTNWIYYNANESALIAIVYHSVANATGMFFFPMFFSPGSATVYWLLAGVNCFAAVVVIVIDRRKWLQSENKIAQA